MLTPTGQEDRIVLGIGIRIGPAGDGRIGCPDLSCMLVSHRGTMGIGSILETDGRLVEIRRSRLESLGDGLDEDLGKKVFGLDVAVYEPVM